LIPTSMTLNDLERRISPYFVFFSPNSIALQADYVTVVEGIIMSVKYCLPVPVFHFWPKQMHPAARSLCDSWASFLTVTLYNTTGYCMLDVANVTIKPSLRQPILHFFTREQGNCCINLL